MKSSKGSNWFFILDAVHDAENPEYSILKQRLARRLQSDGKSEKDVPNLDLVELTKVPHSISISKSISVFLSL